MGAYLRGRVYHYKRMIDGRTYYRSLKIHKGQEPLLSGRIKQVDDEITAAHFGLPLILPDEGGGLNLRQSCDTTYDKLTT